MVALVDRSVDDARFIVYSIYKSVEIECTLIALLALLTSYSRSSGAKKTQNEKNDVRRSSAKTAQQAVASLIEALPLPETYY